MAFTTISKVPPLTSETITLGSSHQTQRKPDKLKFLQTTALPSQRPKPCLRRDFYSRCWGEDCMFGRQPTFISGQGLSGSPGPSRNTCGHIFDELTRHICLGCESTWSMSCVGSGPIDGLTLWAEGLMLNKLMDYKLFKSNLFFKNIFSGIHILCRQLFKSSL